LPGGKKILEHLLQQTHLIEVSNRKNSYTFFGFFICFEIRSDPPDAINGARNTCLS
jgi:hypothetical protein